MSEKKNETGFAWNILLLFFLVGVLFVWIALETVQDSKDKLPLELINKERAELASWPHVMGHLDQVDIISVTYSRPRYPNGTDFWPGVKYHYKVGTHSYEGNCLRLNMACQPDIYFCSDPLSGVEAAKQKLAAFLPSDLPEHVSFDKKGRKIRTYYPHSKVAVYYNANKPDQSQLDNHWAALNWFDYYNDEILEFAFSSCIAFMMFSVCAISIWAQSSKKVGDNAATRVGSKVEMPKAIAPEEQWKIDSSISNAEIHKKE